MRLCFIEVGSYKIFFASCRCHGDIFSTYAIKAEIMRPFKFNEIPGGIYLRILDAIHLPHHLLQGDGYDNILIPLAWWVLAHLSSRENHTA